MSELSELLAQKAALEQKIIEAQRAQKAQAIAQIRQLMSEYGLTLADIGARAPVAARKAAGSKVAPKFRHPQTGETWSGRGLQPKWLKTALAGGAQLDDFKL
jgi:DNA-binding protein H-NS